MMANLAGLQSLDGGFRVQGGSLVVSSVLVRMLLLLIAIKSDDAQNCKVGK